jgi:hypothetical protein
MSTAELAPKNPLEEARGLTHEQDQEARQLKKDYDSANWMRMEGLKEDQKDSWRGYGYLGFIPAALDRAIDKGSERSAVKNAANHYKTHEGAYQEQAVKDAASEGVDTNFGTGHRLEGLPGLSDEDNQEAVNLRWQHNHASRRARELDRRRYRDYHRSVGREINEMMEEASAHRDVRRLEKEQKRHYKEHQGEYQIQAVKDAAAGGVHTSFGEE